MIVGIDPGKYNIAYCFLADGVVEEAGHVLPITGLTEDVFDYELDKFKLRMDRILDRIDPDNDYIVIERYITRPGKGSSAELTNVHIGLIVGWAKLRHIKVHPLPAAQWKMYLQRKYYKEKMELIDFLSKIGLDPVGITDHEVDSCGMAIYWQERPGDCDVLTPECWHKVLHDHRAVYEDTAGAIKELNKAMKKSRRVSIKDGTRRPAVKPKVKRKAKKKD